MPNLLWDVFAWIGIWLTATIGACGAVVAYGKRIERRHGGGK